MANPETYEILSQSPTTEIDPSGRGFMEVWEIAYKVIGGPANGTTGRITVQNSDHTPAYVDRTIKAKLQALHDIASLGGSQS